MTVKDALKRGGWPWRSTPTPMTRPPRAARAVRYEYDTDDRRVKVIYPDGGVRRLKYDSMAVW